MGCLDIAGACLVVFGMVLCAGAIPDNQEYASMAATLAAICGLGATFWVMNSQVSRSRQKTAPTPNSTPVSTPGHFCPNRFQVTRISQFT